MALEEILALISGGLQGESKRRAENASRQRYQQEQAFKQWQVMSDLENKRAQVDQMKAYHEAMAKAAADRAGFYGQNVKSLIQDRPARIDATDRRTFFTGLPDFRTQGGLDAAQSALGVQGDFNVGDALRGSEVVGTERNRITGRHLGNVDRNAIIGRVMASSDPAAAEADANAQLIASGLPPISGRLPQSAAASAAGINARANDRNSIFNTTGPMGQARVATERMRPGLFKAETDFFNVGRIPLAKEELKMKPLEREKTKAETAYVTAKTGNVEFEKMLDQRKLGLAEIEQRWKTDPANPQNIKAYMDFAVQQRAAAREQRLSLQGMVPKDYNRNAIPRNKWTPELEAQYVQTEILAKNLEELANYAEGQFKNYMARNGMAPDGSLLIDPKVNRTVPPPSAQYDANTYPVDPGYRPVPGSLPPVGSVGGQARAAGAKAGFKPQPIKKSAKTPAEKAGVGVKMRKPRTSPKLDSAFGTLGEILKGSPVNPNAGKRPR